MSEFNILTYAYQKYSKIIDKLSPEQKTQLNNEVCRGKYVHIITISGWYNFYQIIKQVKGQPAEMKGYKNNSADMRRFFSTFLGGQFGNIGIEFKKEGDSFLNDFQSILEEERTQKIEKGREILKQKIAEKGEGSKTKLERQLEQKKLEEQKIIDFYQRKTNEYVNKLQILIAQTNSRIYADEANIRLRKFMDFIERIKIKKDILEFEKEYDEKMSEFFNQNLVPLLTTQEREAKEVRPPPTLTDEYNDVRLETEFNGERIVRNYKIPKNQIWLFLDNEQKFYIPLYI